MELIKLCEKDYKAVMNSKIGDTINLEHGGNLDVIAARFESRCRKCINRENHYNSLCYSCTFATNEAVRTAGWYISFVEHVTQ